jgi:hypothetical protein
MPIELAISTPYLDIQYPETHEKLRGHQKSLLQKYYDKIENRTSTTTTKSRPSPWPELCRQKIRFRCRRFINDL